MPNIEWNVPQKISTLLGDLEFNVPNLTSVGQGQTYIVMPDDYKIVPALRVTNDNLSMFDGSLLHPRWKTGLVATLKVIYGISGGLPDFEPACGEILREMHEELMGHLDALRELHSGVNQRYFWSPTGAPSDRLIDDVQLLAWAEPTYDGAQTEVAFALESPFPYGIEFLQTTTSITDGNTAILFNEGSADFYPVLKVYGPATAFSVGNLNALDSDGNPMFLDYDGTLPGAHTIAVGHYIEFDFFRGTAFLDGDVDDRMAGVVPTTTDFWPLVKGSNEIFISGAPLVDVLWNNAYS